MKKIRSIKDVSSKDADYLTSDVRYFTLEPSLFLELLERENPPSLEFLLERLDKEARAILTSHGIPDEDLLNELLWMKWTEEQESRSPDMRVYAARQVLFSIMHLRDMLQSDADKKIVLETFRLLYSSICADIHDLLMTGIRAKQGQKGRKGRRFSKKGIELMIEEALTEFQKQGADLKPMELYKYLKQDYNFDNNQDPRQIGKYRVFFSQGRICQLTDGDKVSRVDSLSKEGFRKFFYQVKKS